MWFLGSVLFLVLVGSSVSAGLSIINPEPGEDVTFRCGDTDIRQNLLFKWVRTDLERTGNVFFYRNNSVDLKDQHESFRNRVFLKDSQMKDGGLSVVLKNVTVEDSGTYQCFINQENDPLGSHWNLSSVINLSVSPPGEIITAELGENVTLTCRDTIINEDLTLRWRKISEKWKGHVFSYSNNRVISEDQDESFRNRVFLKDPQMKDGDLSVVLKNVNIKDSGVYECEVKRVNDPQTHRNLISNILLWVSPPPGVKDGENKDGVKEEENGSSHGVLLGMVLSGLLLAVLVLAVGLWISKNQKGSNQSSRGSNQQQNPDRDLLN